VIIKTIILLILLTMPVLSFSQVTESKAFIQVQSDYPDYIHYTMKIFPSQKDKLFRTELIQLNSAGKEDTLSTTTIKVSSVLYNKGHQMESGKVYLSYYVEIKENDRWGDKHIEIKDCSGGTFLEGSLKLKRNGIYVLRIINQDKMFFEEKVVI
jgi:hypothetical protein